ncbi:peptidylprolyl isomerase [Frigidibacter sp. RF13]|uniref:peptidylprolyl isomerase n=1 Tax=Frigidibacter sp. RF13 TaxID=2997340 RepID=UPI00226ECFEE|nr:peptidylprolyl isomerase [Frigidibacter sp. RF13]MCY1127224.1 peptidylprolyl isomerase [Frigidibacter sp. RF13]
MSDRIFMTGGLAALASIAAAWWLFGQLSQSSVSDADGPGPNLVIEVAGQANGTVVVDLQPELAPRNVAQVVELAKGGLYNGVVFHRVIDGFMAQTGDVQYGRSGGDTSQAGMGNSDLPDLPAEFSKVQFERGVVGMARTNSPDSANSQFFIMFGSAPHLNGEYTVIGHVISGMEVVDKIKRGEVNLGGAVTDKPDVMARVSVTE